MRSGAILPPAATAARRDLGGDGGGDRERAQRHHDDPPAARAAARRTLRTTSAGRATALAGRDGLPREARLALLDALPDRGREPGGDAALGGDDDRELARAGVGVA